MTGDMYMCEHVSKPTLGNCYKCTSERLASRKLAPSNSKSEDTPDPSKVDELTDKLRELLNKDDVWSSEYNSVLLEIEESVCGLLRKWDSYSNQNNRHHQEIWLCEKHLKRINKLLSVKEFSDDPE